MKKYIFFIIIFVLIFYFFYYKNQKLGNTIIKLDEEKIIEGILNGKIKYEADAKVKVYSNKNENEYMLKIEEDKNHSLIQVVSENSISGLSIEKKNGDLLIKNSKLKLEKIYKDYKEITDNSLLLSSFAKDYNETRNLERKNNCIKITLKENSRYIKYKELFIDEETRNPKKLVIKDSSNHPKIIIEYTSINLKYIQ